MKEVVKPELTKPHSPAFQLRKTRASVAAAAVTSVSHCWTVCCALSGHLMSINLTNSFKAFSHSVWVGGIVVGCKTRDQ